MIVLAIGMSTLAIAPIGQAARFTAGLSGANENPANGSPGRGTATAELDTTAHTLKVTAAFTGLTAATTASHIHCCIAPNGNAGVATATPTFPGFPLGVTSGAYNATFDTTQAATWNAAFITANGGTPAGAEAALAAGIVAGQAYLNIHTTAFPGGEIRGFLTPEVIIPTLSEWSLGLLAALVASVGWARLRRRTS